MLSPFYRAMGGPYRGKLLEFCESVLAHLPEVAGQGRPRRTSIWSELTNELCTRAAYDLGAIVETPQRPKTTIADIPPAAEPLALPHAPQEAPEDEKEENTAEHEEDEKMQEKPVDTKEIPGASSSGRGERRTETQENVSVKKRVMMKLPNRPATPVSLPDDPVKRRLLKKNRLAEQ